MPQHFRSQWSTKLKLFSIGFLILCLVIASQAGVVGGSIVLAVLLLIGAFAVRGYSIVDGQLLIHRLGWASRFDLTDVAKVYYSPGVMIGSIRTFGIGGVFGFIGHFHNGVLGQYRAYATDPSNSVVLEFSDKTVVVTPERPADFVGAIESVAPQPR